MLGVTYRHLVDPFLGLPRAIEKINTGAVSTA